MLCLYCIHQCLVFSDLREIRVTESRHTDTQIDTHADTHTNQLLYAFSTCALSSVVVATTYMQHLIGIMERFDVIHLT